MPINPDKKLPRDKFGILLSIETETDKIRPLWLFPSPDQDHVCMLFGYCPIHKCTHEHPSRPKGFRMKKLGKKQGESP
jgi:hypothetical protein